MIVYPTVGGVERRAVNILVDSEAKRQIHLQPEPTTAWIDLYHPKTQPQMKDTKAGVAANLLPDDCRSGRIHAGNADVQYTPHPAGSMRSAQTISIGALTTSVGQLA
jgi:hypothetical protein